MKVQVLVATTNQDDYSLIKKMNIKTNAIVANQCSENSVNEFDCDGVNIKYLNFKEKGVGLNRNNALMRADADICIIADDDLVYYDDYAEIIKQAYNDNPDADIIIFNLKNMGTTRKVINKKTKVGYFNYLRYGTARVSFKLSIVKKHGIYFNQCFGGGTEHSHGEDNLFLNACLKKGLKIIALPIEIAELTDCRPSSWDNGYNLKYVQDQGILYRILSRRWWKMLCFQDAFRRHSSYNMSILKAYMVMVKAGKYI